MDSKFIWGVVVGVGGTYAWHRWVRPMASSKSR